MYSSRFPILLFQSQANVSCPFGVPEGRTKVKFFAVGSPSLAAGALPSKVWNNLKSLSAVG